jgi:hypothetical protein
MKTVGKFLGRFIIASGQGINPGRLAAGAPGVKTYKKDTLISSVYGNPSHGNRPGGLIDKIQQQDPMLTTFGHPFDGGDYKSTATLPLVEPATNWSGRRFNPWRAVPEIAPYEKTQFLNPKVTAVVKTQFGANKSGKKSDTPFHPQAEIRLPRSATMSAHATEKIVNKTKIPSFETTGNLWGSANHSFIAGKQNSLDGSFGVGRWQTVKRSVV